MDYSEKGCYIIPKRITHIEENAFSGYKNLIFITIPECVTSIGNNAFRGTGLRTITIPKNVMHIGEAAFSNCENLDSIRVDPENRLFCSDSGILFSKNKSTLLSYPPGKKDEMYIIPNGVTIIADWASTDAKT